jgi:hypothetical protein
MIRIRIWLRPYHNRDRARPASAATKETRILARNAYTVCLKSLTASLGA